MSEALQILRELPGIQVDFIERIAGVDVDGERAEVLERLEPFHREAARRSVGIDSWWRAEQVHGREVAVIESALHTSKLEPRSGVDGLVTAMPDQALGIYVADCGPIWLADPVTGAIGLLHSGKKGTEANILAAGIEAMAVNFGTVASDVVAVLGPCIRPPDYEVDFAAGIARQAEALGLARFVDGGMNTAADLGRFYSYRRERGRTGRMLALILRRREP